MAPLRAAALFELNRPLRVLDGVIPPELRHGQVLVRALAQVECGQMKAEDLHRAHQRRQPWRHQGLGVVAGQGGLITETKEKTITQRIRIVLHRDRFEDLDLRDVEAHWKE